MAEMTTEQLTEYLKQASLLETSVYKQEKTRQEARKGLSLRTVEKKKIEKPINKAEKMKVPSASTEKGPFEFIAGFGWFIWGVLVVFGILSGEAMIIMMALVFGGIAAAPLLIAGYISKKRQIKKNEDEFTRKYEKYKEEKNRYEEEYKIAMKAYKESVLAEVERVDRANTIAESNFRKAKKEVGLLDAPLYETMDLLEKLYAMDIIFPKYRNMVAMCTMYEYFASGRCTELTGPNGAYNLYESELRQNLIINQLEAVNMNLEQVKQNQYILYQGIMETKQALHTISSDVRNLVNATNDIAVSSRITAYCSQITAANAQAQTYLAIMN